MKTIMYHYIRDNDSRSPYFNNLTKTTYLQQVKRFEKKYGIIKNSDDLLKQNKKILLTFDDGLKDHFFAAKVLSKINRIGIFFLPTLPLESKKILNVHKVHLILGKIKPLIALEELKNYMKEKKIKLNFKNFKTKYKNTYKRFNDNVHKNEFKKIINYLIGDSILQTKLLDHLLNKFKIYPIHKDMYLNNKDIKDMLKMGMIIGSHSHSHTILTNMDYKKQLNEISTSMKILKKRFKIEIKHFCYPYGGKISYNLDTIRILKQQGIERAFTIGGEDTNLLKVKKYDYEIKRYDCNEF